MLVVVVAVARCCSSFVVLCCCWVLDVCRILDLFVDVGRWRCSSLIDGGCSLLYVACLLLLRACC